MRVAGDPARGKVSLSPWCFGALWFFIFAVYCALCTYTGFRFSSCLVLFAWWIETDLRRAVGCVSLHYCILPLLGKSDLVQCVFAEWMEIYFWIVLLRDELCSTCWEICACLVLLMDLIIFTLNEHATRSNITWMMSKVNMLFAVNKPCGYELRQLLFLCDYLRLSASSISTKNITHTSTLRTYEKS